MLNNNMKIGLHLASLYFMYDNYESTLNKRIETAITYGCEHIEISNGPSIMHWSPRDTIPVTFSVHAEVYREFDCTPGRIINHISGWQQLPEYIVWHPNELVAGDYEILAASEVPCLIENMDSQKDMGKEPQELLDIHQKYGFGTCLDIAHIESNGMELAQFLDLPIVAVHVSRSIDNAHRLIKDTGCVVLPVAQYYVIEGIVYTWHSLGEEIALLKQARDTFMEFKKMYSEQRVVSGINNVIIGEI